MRNKGHHEKIYRQVTPMEETIRQIQNAHQGDKAARDRLVNGKYRTGVEHCPQVRR